MPRPTPAPVAAQDRAPPADQDRDGQTWEERQAAREQRQAEIQRLLAAVQREVHRVERETREVGREVTRDRGQERDGWER
jgi:hypothetical protein